MRINPFSAAAAAKPRKKPDLRSDLDRLVTGTDEPPSPAEQYLCWTERGDGRNGHCGQAGRLWKPERSA